MTKFNRALVIVLLALLSLIIVETYVYFNSSQVASNSSKSSLTNQPSNNPNANFMSIPLLKDAAIGKDNLIFMSRLRKNFVSYATASVQAKGIIVDIDIDGSKSTPKVPYQKKITVKNSEGTETSTWYFNDDDLRILKVYNLINNKEELINFNDLKIDDTVTITINFDLTKDAATAAIAYKIIQLP